MILTVTMNPSVDISYPLDELKVDTVNRVSDVSKTAGGKGLNVTRVLTECGEEVLATGLIGGELGRFLVDNLPEHTVPSFFSIAENTRNCIAILHDGQQTEILEAGPTVTEAEARIFLAHFSDLMEKVDVVSISGSLPLGLPVDYYVQLVKIANESNKKVVLDCSGNSLEAVLKSDFKPTVIKPNNEELSQLLGREVSKDINVLKETLQDKLFEGIEWIVVSLGADGCFAKHWDTFYKVDIPQITVVNPVGSGDSTVAGISLGLNDNANDENLLKQANVLGMLNAQEKMTGHVNLENYEYLFELVNVKEV